MVCPQFIVGARVVPLAGDAFVVDADADVDADVGVVA